MCGCGHFVMAQPDKKGKYNLGISYMLCIGLNHWVISRILFNRPGEKLKILGNKIYLFFTSRSIPKWTWAASKLALEKGKSAGIS